MRHCCDSGDQALAISQGVAGLGDSETCCSDTLRESEPHTKHSTTMVPQVSAHRGPMKSAARFKRNPESTIMLHTRLKIAMTRPR
jgi:hypothetical protein